MEKLKLTNERFVADLAGAMLGDPRRVERLIQVAAKVARAPSASLPSALGNDAEVQGGYRLMNNPEVSFEGIHSAHVGATAARALRTKILLAVHDTTPCSFPHLDPEEIGYLNTGKAGFYLHLCLLLDGGVWRRPLGVPNAEIVTRTQRSKGRAKKGKKRSGSQTAALKEREFDRWWRGIQATQSALDGCERVIHIADRESDSYELMHRALLAEMSFIFRVRVLDRRGRKEGKNETWSTVRQVAGSCEGGLEREVTLSRRRDKGKPEIRLTHGARKMRTAKLRFAATRVVVPRPQYLKDPVPAELTLNLVHVTEVDPPKGEKPVEWLLYTTEPIDTPEAVVEVVDNYRARWTIEEFNTALKTGCAYEAREFESSHGLHNMLALSLPIACDLLWLRSRARSEPNAPASDVLSKVQLQVLKNFGPKKLSAAPSAQDALLAVAALGGHLKRNGDPGWEVLYRGYVKLQTLEEGWSAGRRAARDRNL